MACCWRRSIYSKKRFIYYISGGLNQQENLVIRQTLTLSLFALANLSLPAQAATALDLGGIALQDRLRLLAEHPAAAADSNIKWGGAEVRYAILKGSPATPAVAVRVGELRRAAQDFLARLR